MLVLLLGTIALLAVVAVVAAFLLVDPNSFKPRLTAELTRATGRDVTIDGPLKLEAAFPPTVSAEGVSIANIAGGSRPQLASIRRVVARLDVTALFDRRIVVDRIELDHPDLLLETDAQGHPNWRLARQTPAQVSSPSPQPAADAPAMAAPQTPPAEQARFVLESVVIRDAVVTWRDPRGVREIKIDFAKLDGTGSSIDSSVNLTGEGQANGAPFTLTGQTGPLTRLFNRAPATPWPVQLTLQSVALPDSGAPSSSPARLALNGTVAEPARARGYTFTFEGTAPDLAALAPAAGLPHLTAIIVSGHVADSAGPLPQISQLKMHAGPSDLSALVPGLATTQTDLSIPAANEPMQAEVRGTFTGAPFEIAATLGAPASLLPGGENAAATRPPPAPFPLELAGTIAGLKLAAKGDIAKPASLSGVNVAVQASIADLTTLAPLLGRRLPPLHDATFSGRIADGPGGDRHSVAITEARLTAGPGDLSGDATLTFGPRFKLQATLVSKLVDIDALRAMIPPAEAPPGEPTAAEPGPAPTHTVPAPTPPPAGAPPTPFLDRKLPLAALDIADADLALTFDELRADGVSYRDVAGHAVLQNGRLTLDPFAGQTPSGRIEASLSIDGTQPEPPVALTLRAPGLSGKSILALLNLPDDATSSMAVDADLKGTGQTPRALLAGLDGRLGLSMVDGEIDNRALVALAGEVLKAAKLPSELGNGRTRLRCLALRMDASHGTVTIGALVLDTARLLLQGSGSFNLADDALLLRLRPLVRLGTGPGLAVPVRVGGTLTAPKFALDAGGAVAGLLGGGSGGAALQGGRGFSPTGADRNGDLCPPALAAARDGTPGPLPSVPPGGQATSGGGRAADVLRGLIR